VNNFRKSGMGTHGIVSIQNKFNHF